MLQADVSSLLWSMNGPKLSHRGQMDATFVCDNVIEACACIFFLDSFDFWARAKLLCSFTFYIDLSATSVVQSESGYTSSVLVCFALFHLGSIETLELK